MFASEFGVKTSGDGQYWFGSGSSVEAYTNGPFDDEEEAVDEAEYYMDEFGEDVITLGIGEEVAVSVPDADDIIDKMLDSVYDELPDFFNDFLVGVTKEQKDELTALIEDVVGRWLTKNSLWPDFVKVEEVRTLTKEVEE